jgi:hypothetical protein
MVWLYRSPIPVEGVISSFKNDFYLSSLREEEEGRGSDPCAVEALERISI